MNMTTNKSKITGRLATVALLGGIMVATTACTAVEEFMIKDKLDGTSWSAVSIDDFDVPSDVDVTMKFGTDGRVTGLAGCNNYFVDYEQTDSGLNFARIGTTRKICAQPKMIAENLFVDALARANNWFLRDGQLFIVGPNVELTFDRTG